MLHSGSVNILLRFIHAETLKSVITHFHPFIRVKLPKNTPAEKSLKTLASCVYVSAGADFTNAPRWVVASFHSVFQSNTETGIIKHFSSLKKRRGLETRH